MGTLIVDPNKVTHLQGETIDAEGSDIAIRATGGKLRLTDCTIRNAKKTLVDADGPVEVIIDGCTFSDSIHGVRFRGAAKGLVAHSYFSDWLHYAVSVEGTADHGPTVTIDDNEFRDPKAGAGGARYPIFVNNPARVVNIRGLRITNNRIYGPGRPFSKTDPNGGTADQISVYYATEFVVSGNTSSGGGENGISITLGSNRGIVSGNIVTGCDGHGIQVGSLNAPAHDVQVTGNLVDGNGLGADGNKTLAAIYVQDAERVTVSGNQISGKHKHGVLVAVSDYLAVRQNTFSGVSQPVQVDAQRSLHISPTWTIEGPAVVNSTADPILLVEGDDTTLGGLTIHGRYKDDGVRQRGVFSETAKRCRVTRCRFAGMTNGIKLDREADGWTIEDCEFENIFGVKDGYGYGILVGVSGHHRISGCRGRATVGRGRHFVYLSGGASNCVVTDCHGEGFNSSTFAQYSQANQSACVSNTFSGCTARNQLTGHDGTNGGAAEAAAFELTGKVRDTTLRDCSASDIATNGIICNTLGLDAQGLTVERFNASDIKGKELLLIGSKQVRVLDSRTNVEIHPWWKTNPKRASEDVQVVRIGGTVTINPTKPAPKKVTWDGKVLAP